VTNDVSPAPPPGIDTSVPHSARIWNYWLGGKDNYPVDREAGEQFRKAFPEIVDVARATRAFLTRAVTFLAGEAASASSWTSAPGYRRPTIPTRSPSGSPPRPGSCTSTTTRWSFPTPGRC
jgi:hypothetical protein